MALGGVFNAQNLVTAVAGNVVGKVVKGLKD